MFTPTSNEIKSKQLPEGIIGPLSFLRSKIDREGFASFTGKFDSIFNILTGATLVLFFALSITGR